MGRKGPRMLAFMVMNLLYFVQRPSFIKTWPMAPKSKQLLSRWTTWTLSNCGISSVAADSPLKMNAKSALAFRPFSMKNTRFSRAFSDSAYAYSTSGRSRVVAAGSATCSAAGSAAGSAADTFCTDP